MRFDIHVHTTISPCSNLPIEQILSEAQAKKLDGVCITDHNTMDALDFIREGRQPNGLVIIVGMEYETPEGDFLIFGPFEQIPPAMDANQLLIYVDNMNGIAVAAHPWRNQRKADKTLLTERLCPIIEGINGRNSDEQNRKSVLHAEKNGLRYIAASDAHTIDELGSQTTTFHLPINSRYELIKALKLGLFSVDHQKPETELTQLHFPESPLHTPVILN